MTPEVRAYNEATVREFQHKLRCGIAAAITIAEIGVITVFPAAIIGAVITGVETIHQRILADSAQEKADILYQRAKAALRK